MLQMKTECATLGLQKENSDQTSLSGTESLIKDAYGYSPSLGICVYAAEYMFPTLNKVVLSLLNVTTNTEISPPQTWPTNTRTLPGEGFNYNGWVYDCNNLPNFISTGNQTGQDGWVRFDTGKSCGTVWINSPGIDTNKAVVSYNSIPQDYIVAANKFWSEYSSLISQ
jgi:hypothetical protein